MGSLERGRVNPEDTFRNLMHYGADEDSACEQALKLICRCEHETKSLQDQHDLVSKLDKHPEDCGFEFAFWMIVVGCTDNIKDFIVHVAVIPGPKVKAIMMDHSRRLVQLVEITDAPHGRVC